MIMHQVNLGAPAIWGVAIVLDIGVTKSEWPEVSDLPGSSKPLPFLP
jgi:hypothetical protein